jgi:uncharacterized repeat protein (TIGR03803 family)
MHPAGTNSKTKVRSNISNLGSRLGSTKLATAVLRGALTLVVIAVLVLVAARPAQAQTEAVLYNFAGSPDGATPESSLTFYGGNLYGTTELGGVGCQSGCGTVFELSPNGNGGWNETFLHSFTGGADGAYPTYCYVIFDSVGNLYGTTYGGGANGYGVVFELSPAGASWTETVLYNFIGGAAGFSPIGGLIRDAGGNLYGTTQYSASGYGTVFELSQSDGNWTEQVLYTLETQSNTTGGLTIDVIGNIYGVTSSTVFELSPNGNSGWNPTVIHTFSAQAGGVSPEGALVLDKAGNLYGTTSRGGPKNFGIVYKLSHFKKSWKFQKLGSFYGGKKDGGDPYAGIVFDAAGNIYGTTPSDGMHGGGTVYELVAPVGRGGYKQKVLWNFNGADGAYPLGSLILDNAGNLYGTTSGGGLYGGLYPFGVVFEVTP